MYQRAAFLMGKDKTTANIVYGVVDMSMSGYGAGRLMLKPDAWRLFRYVKTDYIRGYEKAGSVSLMLDTASGFITLDAITGEGQ